MTDKGEWDYPITTLPPEVIRKQAIMLGEVQRTAPTVGIFDSPTRCYIVNKEWASHIMGMVHLLADVMAWKNADDEGYFAITEILKFMQGMECMDFSLRQNPEDNCILQQTLDGGENWTDVFDFSLCETIQDGASNTAIQNNYYNELNNFQNNVYNNYVANYAGDITNIHPELGYGDNDDTYRDDALCYSLGKLIDSICEASLAALEATEDVGNDLRTSLALISAVLGILILAGTGIGLAPAAIMAASLAAAGIGLGAAIGAAIYDKLQEIAIESLTDETAKDELQCCLKDAMEGTDANHASLIDAFTACTGLSDHANDIRELGAIMIAELAFYAAFAENLTIAFQSAKLSLLPSCPCGGGIYPALVPTRCQDALELGVLTQIDVDHWHVESEQHTDNNFYCFMRDEALSSSATFKILEIANKVHASGLENGSQTFATCQINDVFSWTPGQIGALNSYEYMFSSDVAFSFDIEVSVIGA